MNFLKRLPALLAILILTFFISCTRNNDLLLPEDNTPTGNVVNPSPVNASVQGSVVDQNNNPVSGATVKAAGNVTTTDSRGLFRFNRINIDKYASVVTVEANGYFKGIRTFSAKEGASHFVKLKLLTKNLAGNVDAAAGGTVTLPDNSQVIFSAASIVVKSTGAVYTGGVRVYAANIDPTADDIAETVPGSFQGEDSSQYRVILKSFGMVAVQLEGSTGEQLQLAPGKTAKLHVVIPASRVAQAPDALPLWYMDETTGLWKQQGNALKTGNAYEGDVSHFSFWNCDASANTVFFEVTINTANGPLPNALVKLTLINNGWASYGYTDSLGHVGGLIFANEPLKLEVVNNCNGVIYTQNIGPFNQDINFGNITVPITTQNSLVISGNAVDCASQPLNNGTALIYFEGQLILRPVVNGQFDATVLSCSTGTGQLDVIVNDNTTNQQSTTWTGVASGGTVNVGTLTACGISSDEYVNYVVDGISYSINSSTSGDSLRLLNMSTVPSQNINLLYSSRTTAPATQISFGWTGNTIGPFSIFSMTPVNTYDDITIVTPLSVNVTNYGPAGMFAEGNFSGSFVDNITSITHTVSATFKIRKWF